MTILEYLLAYRYLAIFLGVIVEGPVVIAAVGFLAKLGYFDLTLGFLVLMIGDLVSDALWYALGYFRLYGFAVRFGNFIGFKKNISDRIAKLYLAHQNKVIIISKLSMGFGFNLIVLVTAGILRIPFRKFILLNAVGELFWVGVFMTLGYFFGNIYLAIDHGLRLVSVIVAVVFLLLTLYGSGRFMRAQFLKRTASL